MSMIYLLLHTELLLLMCSNFLEKFIYTHFDSRNIQWKS